LQQVAALLRESPDPLRREAQLEAAGKPSEVLTWPVAPRDPNAFTISQENGGFRVRGQKIEQVVSMLNFAQQEALDRLQRVLERSGISDALREAGIEEGDRVFIEKAELEWSEELGR